MTNVLNRALGLLETVRGLSNYYILLLGAFVVVFLLDVLGFFKISSGLIIVLITLLNIALFLAVITPFIILKPVFTFMQRAWPEARAVLENLFNRVLEFIGEKPLDEEEGEDV